MLRVGDKVRIMSDLSRSESGYCVPEMMKYGGKIATVLSSYSDRSVYLDVDNGQWVWHVLDLELKNESPFQQWERKVTI